MFDIMFELIFQTFNAKGFFSPRSHTVTALRIESKFPPAIRRFIYIFDTCDQYYLFPPHKNVNVVNIIMYYVFGIVH